MAAQRIEVTEIIDELKEFVRTTPPETKALEQNAHGRLPIRLRYGMVGGR